MNEAPSKIKAVSQDQPTGFFQTAKNLETDFQKDIVQAAYRYCAKLTKAHYENFPVASLLVPKKKRAAIQAIYAFARLADDFADEPWHEGNRLPLLMDWEDRLNNPQDTHPVFIALHNSLKKHAISKQNLLNLLTAFKMDVQNNRHENFEDLLHYCTYSANPVGRLVLEVFEHKNEKFFALSDFICTALQLTNFWQDVAIDLQKNRIYLPAYDRHAFNVSEDDLFQHKATENFRTLMDHQWKKTAALFEQGKELGSLLPGFLGVEIRLTWLGGVRLLEKIKAARYNVFDQRPTLSKKDFAGLLFIAISKKRYAQYRIKTNF